MGVETVIVGTTVAAAATTGIAAHRAAQGQQLVAERQADNLKQQAAIAEEQSVYAYNKVRTQAGLLRGKQAAAAAAANLDISSGTPASIMEQTDSLSEADAKQAKLNAMRQAWGLSAQADITNAEGDMAMKAGQTKMYTSFLGGAAQSAATYNTLSPSKTPKAEAPRKSYTL